MAERVSAGGLHVRAQSLPNNKGVSSLTVNSEGNQPVEIASSRVTGQREHSYGDLSAIMETSERGSERFETGPIGQGSTEQKQGVATRAAAKSLSPDSSLLMQGTGWSSVGSLRSSGSLQARTAKSLSSDSSLIMQGTGWSGSVGSLRSSGSLQARAVIPEGSVVNIGAEMQNGYCSSSDGNKMFTMHTGLSSSSDASKISPIPRIIKRPQPGSSTSLSTINMHTSDDSMYAEQGARLSMNVEAKKQQLIQMRFINDDGSDSSESASDLAENLRDVTDEPVEFIAPLKTTGAPEPPPSEAGSSGPDSFLMPTGWSTSLDDLSEEAKTPEQKVKKSGSASAPVPPSEAVASGRDSFLMPTGWSASLGDFSGEAKSPALKVKKSGSASPPAPPSEARSSGPDSFLMPTGWSSRSLGDLSGEAKSPALKAYKSGSASALTPPSEARSSGRDSFLMPTGWSMSLGDLSGEAKSPALKAKKSGSASTLASPSEAGSSGRDSFLIHKPVDEESSMREEDMVLKPASLGSGGSPRASATMVMMDGSFRSV